MPIAIHLYNCTIGCQSLYSYTINITYWIKEKKRVTLNSVEEDMEVRLDKPPKIMCCSYKQIL